MISLTPVIEAHEWLRTEFEKVLGSSATWSEGDRDRFHRDLGLLVDFVTRDVHPPATPETPNTPTQ